MRINKLRLLVYMILISSLFIISCHTIRTPQHNTSAGAANETDLNSLVLSTFGNERNIDMSLFKKAVLDIPYAGTSNIRQTLDIVYPSAGQAPYKVIVLFHGGGWIAGNKRSETLASIFQAIFQGYALISVNYRLSNEVRWPKPLHDAKAAIRFIRANRDKYQLDTENLVVWGVSAGGHIAEMLAATNRKPTFEDFTMGSAKASSTVQGVVAWSSVTDLSALTDLGTPLANKVMGYDVRANKSKTHDANPINLVNSQYPPILLVHGTKDQVVPYQQSVDMLKKVNDLTGKETAQLITFEGAGHSDPVIKTNESVAKNLDFIDLILYGGNNPYRDTSYVDIRIKP